MRRQALSVALAAALTFAAASSATAQKYQKTSSTEWIEQWLSLELVMNTGGFAASAVVDYIADGTKGQHTHEKISTAKGLGAAEKMIVALDAAKGNKDNGGKLTWKVVKINTADGNNMSTSWGLPDQTNITWHGIIGILSPKKKDTTMHPAHDDHAQIWLNGEKVYDNSQWTGGVRTVTTPTDVTLLAGMNVLLFKCGESGGSDYVNLHFDDSDKDLDILPTTDGKFFQYVLAVEPQGKAAAIWADLKAR